MIKLSLPHLNPHNTMDRINIQLADLKCNGNQNFVLLHDATAIVSFTGGLTNPLPPGYCFALYFYKFEVGVSIQKTPCSIGGKLRHIQFTELSQKELRLFTVPAECMNPADSWEDWKSPITKHIFLNHLNPQITVRPSPDGDTNSVEIHIQTRVEYPGGSTGIGVSRILCLRD